MPGTARRWTVGQLADFELADERIELEQTIKAALPGSPGRAALKARLVEIAGEQEARGPGRLARRGQISER
jgi:hypothetical protein